MLTNASQEYLRLRGLLWLRLNLAGLIAFGFLLLLHFAITCQLHAKTNLLKQLHEPVGFSCFRQKNAFLQTTSLCEVERERAQAEA